MFKKLFFLLGTNLFYLNLAFAEQLFDPASVYLQINQIETKGSGSSIQFDIEIPLGDFKLPQNEIYFSTKFLGLDSHSAKLAQVSHVDQSHDRLYIRGDNLVGQFTSEFSTLPKSGHLHLQLILFLDLENPGLGSVLDFDLGAVSNLNKDLKGRRIPKEQGLNLLNFDVDMGIFENLQSPNNSERALNKYNFKTLRLKYGGVERSLETSISRSVRILVTACIEDPILFKPVRFKRFKIKSFKKLENPKDYHRLKENNLQAETYTLETDSEGCLRWRDRLHHNWYVSERNYIKPYQIIDEENNTDSYLAAVINPWNTSWLFARDLREVAFSDLNEVSSEKPEVFMSKFWLSSTGVDYEIRQDLGLSIAKKFNLNIAPQVVRHDSLARGHFGGEALRDGHYLLHVVLLKDPEIGRVSSKNYITHWSQLVPVKRGQLNASIQLTIDDIKLMGARNHIVFQVLPIDQNKIIFRDKGEFKSIDQEQSLAQKELVLPNTGLQSSTFYGPFIPIHLNQSAPLVPSPSLSAENLIQQGLEHKETRQEKSQTDYSIDHFDQHFRLKALYLNHWEDQDWLSEYSERDKTLVNLLKKEIYDNSVEIEDQVQMGHKLCRIWVRQLIPELADTHDLYGREDYSVNEADMEELKLGIFRRCLSAAMNKKSLFRFDKILITKNLDKNSLEYLGGTSFNYNVNANMSLYKNQFQDVRKGHSSDLSFSAGLGADFKFFKLSTNRSESYSAGESVGHGFSTSGSLSYGSGAYLVVQNSLFNVLVNHYERCLVVKPDLSLIEEFLNSQVGRSLKIKAPQKERSFIKRWMDMFSQEHKKAIRYRYYRELIDDQQKLHIFESGLRICSGTEETEPVKITENYFYVTQHFLAGDMHDPAHIKNRPWLLSIRTKRDFLVFLQAIQHHNKMQDAGNYRVTPIDTLAATYKDFKTMTPSWPGVYTFTVENKRFESQCDPNQNLMQNILQEAKEILAGPLAAKDGNNPYFQTDFWQIYYCPEN